MTYVTCHRSARLLSLVGILLLGTHCSRAPATGEEPKGFQGIPWGTPMTTVAQQFPTLRCGPDARWKEDACQGDLAITDDITAFTILSFASGGLDHVYYSFPSIQFGLLRPLLVARYGPPTTHIFPVVKTRSGVEMLNETLVWKGTRANITLEQHGGLEVGVDVKAVVRYETPEALQAWRARQEQQVQAPPPATDTQPPQAIPPAKKGKKGR